MNPQPFLKSLLNEQVIVHLKWDGTEYKGILKSTDSYMNFQLLSAEEFINGQSKGVIGDVLIRCNNVMWVASAKS